MTYPDYITKIKTFYRKCRRLPSYSEILDLTGLKSKNSVYKLVKHMISQKLLEKDTSGHFIPGPLFKELRMLGYVEAGWPSPAEEELQDTVDLDQYMISNKEATFIFKVRGDSMIDAGIVPGDIVLVERGREAKDNDIVIAEVDHKWTMKYFRKKGREIYLEAANKKYKPIYPKEDLKIGAVVIGLLRKYHT